MSRSKPIRAVAELVRKGGIVRLEHAGRSRIGMPDGASIIDAPRLILGLSGMAAFRVARDAADTRRVRLKPGDALYVPPTFWVKAEPARRYHSMGIIFQPDLTRLYVMESVRGRDGWRTVMRAADERAALEGVIARGLLAILDKPDGDMGEALREKSAANFLLTECAGLPGCSEGGQSTGIAWQRWQAARHYVDEHLQQPIDRKTVAAALGLHPNHLSRLFTRFHDKNFSQYVLHARMARADLLLADDRLNISDVAYLCGFSTPNYFTRLYTLLHGMPPGKRRARGL